jgi:hypothetical protein
VEREFALHGRCQHVGVPVLCKGWKKKAGGVGGNKAQEPTTMQSSDPACRRFVRNATRREQGRSAGRTLKGRCGGRLVLITSEEGFARNATTRREQRAGEEEVGMRRGAPEVWIAMGSVMGSHI